jgi:hypothetical protein
LSEKDSQFIYSQRQVRHFYSPGEIASFQERWRNPGLAIPKSKIEAVGKEHKPSAETASSRQRDWEPTCGHKSFSGAKLPKHPHHPRTCRPCTQCASELQLVPQLQHACQERLELINRLDEQLRSVSLPGQPKARHGILKNLIQRLFRGSRAA